MNIMDKERLFDLLKSKIEEADAIVVGGASGMSAASGFRFYYQDDEVFRQMAGSLRETAFTIHERQRVNTGR